MDDRGSTDALEFLHIELLNVLCGQILESDLLFTEIQCDDPFDRSRVRSKRIPKQKFYENLDVSPTLHRVFVDQIRLVYWRNKLAASTLNIAAGEAVTEIEVFEVRLNEPLLDAAVLKQIDKEIPYHLLFILTCDGKAQEWIGYILQNAIVDAYVQCGIETIYHEYYELISTTPDISQEDYLYIQEIVSNSMSKRLSVERDENRRLRIRLSNQEFLGVRAFIKNAGLILPMGTMELT
ncbi:DUF4391 domain-containing protein [Flintibacter sp.]|uniref:DUF4391 domain-containing protein n=1 Tax=Flintibacter sp. TaxID=1918624 RepID=UPI0034A0CB9C